MEQKQFVLLFLEWLTASAPSLVQLLGALVPVMALAVAGYALHVTSKKGNRK